MQQLNVIGKLLDVWNIYMRAVSLFMLNFIYVICAARCVAQIGHSAAYFFCLWRTIVDGYSVGLCICRRIIRRPRSTSTDKPSTNVKKNTGPCTISVDKGIYRRNSRRYKFLSTEYPSINVD